MAWMAWTSSTDLRARVIAAVYGSLSRRAAAKRFGVGVATAIRWVRAFRTTGTIDARQGARPAFAPHRGASRRNPGCNRRKRSGDDTLARRAWSAAMLIYEPVAVFKAVVHSAAPAWVRRLGVKQ